MQKDVDYLPMAKSVRATNHSRIRRDCACLQGKAAEGGDPGLRTGRSNPKLVRTRNKALQLLGFALLVPSGGRARRRLRSRLKNNKVSTNASQPE
jgi:hypothetical protein